MNTYLGSFSKGSYVNFTLWCLNDIGVPTDPLYTPMLRIRDSSLVESVPLIYVESSDEVGTFHAKLHLDSDYDTGTYLAVATYVLSGPKPYSFSYTFRVNDSGDSDGQATSMFAWDKRPNLRIMMQRATGDYDVGRNPRIVR